MCTDEFRRRYGELVAGMLTLNSAIDEKLNILDAAQKKYDTTIARVSEDTRKRDGWVKLDVGGRIFASTKSNFLRWKGTYFHELLQSDLWNPDIDGAHCIDRDPALFDRVMTSLRTGNSVDFTGLSLQEANRLQEEIDYYQLEADNVRPKLLPGSLKWDENLCNPDLRITGRGRTVKSGCYEWSACLCASPPDLPSFTVRLKGQVDTWLGYAKEKAFRIDDTNYTCSGWFLSCSTGKLNSGFGHCNISYTKPLAPNSLVTVYFDKAAKTISYEINGEQLGIAFCEVFCGDGCLFPCAELWEGSIVTLQD